MIRLCLTLRIVSVLRGDVISSTAPDSLIAFPRRQTERQVPAFEALSALAFPDILWKGGEVRSPY